MRNKGQVASGLSWFVGFVIIFFIMFLFVGASLNLAGKEKVKKILPFSGEEGDELQFGKAGGGSLILTEQLISFLETEIETEKSVRDLILQSNVKEVRDFNPDKRINSNHDLFVKTAEEIFSKTMPSVYSSDTGIKREFWSAFVYVENIENKFYDRQSTGESASYFAAGNLFACRDEREIEYSEIKVSNELTLVLCFNFKDYGDSKNE